MGTSIIPLNSAQRVAEKTLNGTALSAATNTIYTCPAGKKAKITGSVLLDNYGAASTVALNVNGVPAEQWVILTFSGSPGVPVGDYDASAATTATGITATQTMQYRRRFIEIILEAGQTLTKSQNIGDNATLYYTLKLLELPA